MTVEFKTQGWYLLLTDKGDPSLIGRRTNSTPIPPMGGGCDNNTYDDGADPFLKNTISIIVDPHESGITPTKQQVYRDLLAVEAAVIDPHTHHAKENGNVARWTVAPRSERAARLHAAAESTRVKTK